MPGSEDNNSSASIHLKPRQLVLQNSDKWSSNRYSQVVVDPIFCDKPNVKKSRKRRDRKASGTPQIVAIEHDSDDDDDAETPKRSRSLAARFMLWFCGMLIVIIGAGALLYAIAIVCTSMDKVTKFFQTIDKKGMLTESWRTKEFIEVSKKKNWI